MLLEADDYELPALVREDLAVLQRVVGRLAATFERLLRYASTPPRVPEPVDLNDVVGEILGLLERPLASGGIQVRVDLDPAPPTIWGHAEALQEVLVNLVLDVRAAMTRGGALRIETRRTADAEGIRLVVADDGLAAVSPEPPSPPVPTSGAAGHGQRLEAVERIVRAHGGSIEVEPRPGRGAVHVLTFPTALGVNGRHRDAAAESAPPG